jgi:hypothetical protein
MQPQVPVCVEAILEKPMENISLCIAIPSGVKGVVWFSREGCYILTLSKDGKSFDNVTCDNSFHYNTTGTILYGTFYFMKEEQTNFYFTIEDIYLYNYKDVRLLTIQEKIQIWNHMLANEIQPFNIHTSQFIIGIPFIKNTWREMCDVLPHISYKIHAVRFHFKEETEYSKSIISNYHTYYYYLLNNQHTEIKHNDNQIDNSKIFWVQADNVVDIYYLFTDNEDLLYVGIACIQTLKTSLFMSSIFRNMTLSEIEMINDYDDEYKINKIDVEKRVRMNCVYNTRFKKWTPVSIV